MQYKVFKNARALNWLTKDQTSTKTLPYIFSQCEDANCRSLIPLQDTPSVKFTYSSQVYVESPIQVFMTGNLTSKSQSILYQRKGFLSIPVYYNVFNFESKIPIASYVIAIVAGNVV